MKVADYLRRFYTCNIHHKLLMMFQYDVTADVFLVTSARVWRFYATTSRRTEPGSKEQAVKTGDHLVRERYTVYSSWIIHKSPLTLPLGDQPR